MLNLILPRGWTDYDNFSFELASRIAEARPSSRTELDRVMESFDHQFFALNRIRKDEFVGIFPAGEILRLINRYTKVSPITFLDVFTETSKASISKGEKSVSNLSNLPERRIQEALVESLREKNATNCRGRTKDTVLEVADLEHFALETKRVWRTFAAVVKGYKSVSGKTVTWEDISHQITKAYNRTNPDHIIVVLAKNPADSVISELVQYSKSVGNDNLVIFADPLTLARFLKARNLIR